MGLALSKEPIRVSTFHLRARADLTAKPSCSLSVYRKIDKYHKGAMKKKIIVDYK
jgi:hypothetical protein